MMQMPAVKITEFGKPNLANLVGTVLSTNTAWAENGLP